MRNPFLAAVLSLAVAGCRPEDVSVYPPDPPPDPGSVAACSAAPSALTHLRGIAPQFLGADELNLYAVAGPEGAAPWSLWRIPKDGSSPQLLARSETPIVSLALSSAIYPVASAVFWATAGARDSATGAVWSRGLGAADKPVLLASGVQGPTALATTDPSVYWAEQEIDSSGKPIEAIVEISAAGEPIQRVLTLNADQIPRTILGYAYLRDGSIDGTLLWTTFDPELGNERTAEIVESVLPSGRQTRIAGPATGGVGALAPAMNGTGILYGGPTGIVSILLAEDGGVALEPLLGTGGFVDRIDGDGVDLYFVDRTTQRLMAGPPSGTGTQSPPRTLVNSVDPATAFTVDRACVYWVDARAETIAMRTTR